MRQTAVCFLIKEVRWFNFNEIPFDKMIADNKEWLPKILDAY